MDFGLSGHAAIVTGSTSGIGKALADALAASGVNVMLNGFGDAAAIEAERAGMEASHGVKVLYDPADMTKGDQIAAMVARARAEFEQRRGKEFVPQPLLDRLEPPLDYRLPGRDR